MERLVRTMRERLRLNNETISEDDKICFLPMIVGLNATRKLLKNFYREKLDTVKFGKKNLIKILHNHKILPADTTEFEEDKVYHLCRSVCK